MYWLFLAAVGVAVALWLRWRYVNRRLIAIASKIPGPPTVPIIGNAYQFMCRPEGKDVLTDQRNQTDPKKTSAIFLENQKTYGDIVRFWLGPDLNIFVCDPDDLKSVLSNPKSSVKGIAYKYMADVIGGGILSGSGPKWRKHRKIAVPNFGRRAIDSYSGVFNEEARFMMQKYQTLPRDTPFDIFEEIVMMTSYTVCRTLMGQSREETMNLPHMKWILDNTHAIYGVIFGRMTKWYLQIDIVFRLSAAYRFQKNMLEHIHIFSEKIVDNRVAKLDQIESGMKNDLMRMEEDLSSNTQLCVIDRFLLSQMNPYDLIDETFTIFTASQEPTAKIASFLLLMLGYHPDCQDKIYNEIKEVFGEEKRDITDEDFKSMPYLDMTFKETVRLFPIGTIIQRSINEDIVLDSVTLPAGSQLACPIYLLHRDPRFWDKPNAFNPDRFNPENTRLRHPNAYIPFSLGQMDCLGRHFGIKLVKTVVVSIVRDYQISTEGRYEDLKHTIEISAAPLGNKYLASIRPRAK